MLDQFDLKPFEIVCKNHGRTRGETRRDDGATEALPKRYHSSEGYGVLV